MNCANCAANIDAQIASHVSRIAKRAVKARNRSLSDARRSEIAQKASLARWGKTVK